MANNFSFKKQFSYFYDLNSFEIEKKKSIIIIITSSHTPMHTHTNFFVNTHCEAIVLSVYPMRIKRSIYFAKI